MIAPLPSVRKYHRPQAGFQYRVTCSRADITICGGAANCGKTRVAILEAARDTWNVPGMSASFFRRTTPEITNPGGIWDESLKVYRDLGGVPTAGRLLWRWKDGGKVTMHHLEHESSVEAWQGAQLPLIIFDELTHFTAKQFWYLTSRNRSNVIDSDGRRVRARVIATCNPDADSWVADLIAWWIDQDETKVGPDGVERRNPGYGFPIKARAGVLRYFTRDGDEIVWGNTKAEVMAKVPGVQEIDVRSLTFIPGKITDNKLGDPRYRGVLMGLSRVERGRLLDGNWKIRAAAGDCYNRSEVTMLDTAPPAHAFSAIVRRWDLAATEPSEKNKDPDWTVGVKMGKRADNGKYVVLHVERARLRSDAVRKLIRRVAEIDGPEVAIVIPQDPAQAGVSQVASFMTLLDGFSVSADRETGDKFTRQDPFSAQWQHGNVEVVRAGWNSAYFSIMEAYPTKGVHDDDVDASAGAYHHLLSVRTASMFD